MRGAKACLGRKDQRGETVTFLAVCSQPCSGNSCLDTQRLIPSFISMGNKARIPQIIKAEMWTKRTTALLCNIRKRWVEYTHFQNAEMSWQDRPRARKEMASWLPTGGLFVSLFCKYFGYLHEDKESFGLQGWDTGNIRPYRNTALKWKQSIIWKHCQVQTFESWYHSAATYRGTENTCLRWQSA